jgi:predicted MFS family arabinose efflux permease
MLGLFMILPVLPLFSEQLEGSTPALIGLAMGIYGLPQVFLQIPFGLLSDKFGRKKIILIGLSLFFTGSVIASLSTTIYGVLVGRAFQGAGAVSAVVMALVADLTQEVHRTKAMAVIGASIGISFGVGIVLGPIISHFGGVQMVFAATAVLTALAMLSVLYVVPNPQKSKLHRDAEFVPEQAMRALKNPDLLRLDYGIFIQHLLLMAIFVVIPSLMRQAGLIAGHEWMVYLPIFATSMAAMIPFIILAEKKRKMKAVFLGAVGVLALSALGLAFLHDNLTSIIALLWLFFCGFNLLEATLPSLISKTAPADLKGTAMGAYSSCQFMGLFLGGVLGGWVNGHYGVSAVFLFCGLAALSWFAVSLTMNPPRYLSNLLISLENLSDKTVEVFVAQLQKIAGVVEVSIHNEEAVAYLKVDSHLLDKVQLQTLLDQYSNG